MTRCATVLATILLLTGPSYGQEAHDAAQDRASDGAFDAADTGVGAAAEQDHEGRTGVPDPDERAAERTFGGPPSARTDSPEGTLQEEGAIVEGLID